MATQRAVVREDFLEEGMCRLDLKVGKKQEEKTGGGSCVPTTGHSMYKGPEKRKPTASCRLGRKLWRWG